MSDDNKQLSLEDRLNRLKEIQDLLVNNKVPLAESVNLLEEATKLKKEIEKELKEIENKLIKLSEE